MEKLSSAWYLKFALNECDTNSLLPIDVSTCPYTNTHTNTHAHTHTNTHTQRHTNTHTQTHTHTDTEIHNMYIHACAPIDLVHINLTHMYSIWDSCMCMILVSLYVHAHVPRQSIGPEIQSQWPPWWDWHHQNTSVWTSLEMVLHHKKQQLN